MTTGGIISFIIVGIAATLYTRHQRNKRQAQINDMVTQALTRRPGSPSVTPDVSMERVEDWKEFKASVLDVYGMPDECFGPWSLEKVLATEPWKASCDKGIESVTGFMFLYFDKGIAWSLKLYDMSEVDHVIIHPVPAPPMIHFYFKGEREDEFVFDGEEGSVERYLEQLRRFPGLSVELFSR